MARRRRINWSPVLWCLTVVNVLAGLAWSPMTSAAKVRVVGALPSDQERIREAVQRVKGKPALRDGAQAMLEAVYRRPDVRKVTWTQNLFRRGLLTVTYDPPVARLMGQPSTVLTARGQLSPTQEDVSGLPEVEFFALVRSPMATLGRPVELQRVADVCRRAVDLQIDNVSIQVQETGAVCLNSGKAGRVLLGAPDDLDAKFEKLDELLAGNPRLLTAGKEIVLIAPSKPTVRPMGSP